MNIDILAKEVAVTAKTSYKMSVSMVVSETDFDDVLDEHKDYIIDYIVRNYEAKVVEAIAPELPSYGYTENE